MGASRGAIVALLIASGCGASPSPDPREQAHEQSTAEQPRLPVEGCEREHWPVRPCDAAVHADRVGAWFTDHRTFVYDGCTVAYRAPNFDAVTTYCGRGHVVFHNEQGDPPPYDRARARWDGDELIAETSSGPRSIARWQDGGFVAREYLGGNAGDSDVPMHRAQQVEEIHDMSRPLLCAQRIQPSREELDREYGPECPGQ